MESPFAVVRLRTSAGKRYKANATALIWTVLMVAEKSFRRLDSPELLLDVAGGATYQDGKRVVSEAYVEEPVLEGRLHTYRRDLGIPLVKVC